jgi:Glucokinase
MSGLVAHHPPRHLEPAQRLILRVLDAYHSHQHVAGALQCRMQSVANRRARAGVGDYVALASEGSHAGFAPRGALQQELLRFAEAELEMPCEVEHVACGTGLKRIHRFLTHKHGEAAQELVRL